MYEISDCCNVRKESSSKGSNLRVVVSQQLEPISRSHKRSTRVKKIGIHDTITDPVVGHEEDQVLEITMCSPVIQEVVYHPQSKKPHLGMVFPTAFRRLIDE